ncbi:uncharacterized protein BKCO1_2600036 [Diplodia corticola]|uniref:Integral membrane protein n=1 Tax=Diplodia corticola TaxID=236234 RepID=A0A1J9R068_9PEZI|nr:uncharacterized protein BKCO1_2600036 [Diplodia corticola]OJD34001.1 hypothetical protein BKCO1_2600036 [Diplodia corticola]
MMGPPRATVFVVVVFFILGCYALSPEEAASETCYPRYSYEYLWVDASNSTTTEDPTLGGSVTKQSLPDKKISKIKDSDKGTAWLTKMKAPAPLFVVNDTKATAFRAEKEGWRIMGAEFQWWWMYYVEDDWSLQMEHDGLVAGNYSSVDPLENIRYDIDQYSAIAFPCNSTLSNTLQDENTNISSYGSEFIRKFRAKMDDLYLSDNIWSDLVTQYLRDELQDASRSANQTANSTHWKVTASYMGVGWNVRCWGDINAALNMATEWDKAASSAATTLMALIPVLLTFGNLILPRDSEAFCSSFLVGIMSAAFSLGLPGMSISAITRKLHRIDVGSFEYYRQSIISKLGRRQRADGRARPKAFYKVTFSSLRSWLTAPPDDGTLPCKQYVQGLSNAPIGADQVACSNTFWHMRQEVDKWRSRPHYWHILGLIVFVLQSGIFVAGIGPLFLNMGTPLFMFSCDQDLSSLWMLVTAATNAVFRFVMWEFSSHERVRVYALSEKTKESLDRMIQISEHGPDEGVDGVLKSTETELPPRYHPLIGRGLRAYYRTLSSSASSVRKQYRRVSRQSGLEPDGPASLYCHNEDIDTIFQSVKSQCLFFWYHWVRFPFTRPLEFIRIGFRTSSGATDSARRWRPVTVLMHLSSSGRNPFAKLLTGLMEGSILLLLTIFFSAQWGGNIFVVSYTIALLLIFVTAGRLLSLFYIWQSAKTLGLHVIECQSDAQISGSLRIICSMTGVLVVVNGAYYYDGHRLDERQGWNTWRAKYDRGDYDEDRNNARTRSQSAPANHGSFSRHGGFREALKIRRKPVGVRQGLPRHRSDGSQAEILLQDIPYHSRSPSDHSLASSMPRAPEATAGHP